jgi:carbon-monoxide dehydrogenase large subunit
MDYIGQRVARREDFELITGSARTVADLRLPDTVELAFLRSPLAHARLRGVDVSAATDRAGVVGAWSAAELAGLPPVPSPQPGVPRWPSLATDTVRYPGEPLAVVAASTRALAEDAVEAIVAELEPLPPLAEPADALAAPPLFADRDSNMVLEHAFGAAAEDAFAGAAFVVEAEYRQQYVLPAPMEPRALLVAPDGAGLTVWVSHQAQHRLRDGLAAAFGLAPDEVRVIVPATGGAFGSKSQTYPEYVVAAHLARLLGRPVRWCEDRAEAMLAATRGRGQRQRVRLAADSDGRFLAYELDTVAGVGGYPHTGSFVPMMTGALSTGAYRTPNVHATVRCVLTTTVPTSAYRGAGRPEAAYAIERTVDQLARRMRMDPVELRRRNLIDTFPYRTPSGANYDSGNYAAALDLALSTVDYDGVRAEQARRRRDGGWPLGVGIAVYVERSGGPPDSDEFGSVEVCPDGTVIARCGSTPTGQGHLTAFAQLVASALGIDLDRVRVVEGDTAEIPYGFGTFGSRSMQVGGASLWEAASGVMAEARRRYAEEQGAPDATYSDGSVSAGGASMELSELVKRTGPLRVDKRFVAPQAFPYGAYAAVVEVDPDLGTVGVRQLVAVDDYGVVVNPMIVDGQTHGSIAQGLGQALYEQALYREDGMPYARTLLEYLLPTIAEIPPVTLRQTRTPNPNTPIGAKGAGETGCIGTPPAIVNAVCDALDVDHIDMPVTPEAVWRAIASRPA